MLFVFVLALLSAARSDWCEGVFHEEPTFRKYRWRMIHYTALRAEWAVTCSKPCMIFVAKGTGVDRRALLALHPDQRWDNVRNMSGTFDSMDYLAQSVVVGFGSLLGTTSGTIRLNVLLPNGTMCNTGASSTSVWWHYLFGVGGGIAVIGAVACICFWCCYCWCNLVHWKGVADRRIDDFGHSAVIDSEVRTVQPRATTTDKVPMYTDSNRMMYTNVHWYSGGGGSRGGGFGVCGGGFSGGGGGF